LRIKTQRIDDSPLVNTYRFGVPQVFANCPEHVENAARVAHLREERRIGVEPSVGERQDTVSRHRDDPTSMRAPVEGDCHIDSRLPGSDQQHGFIAQDAIQNARRPWISDVALALKSRAVFDRGVARREVAER
jgi:hypothetical protein